MRFEPMDFYSLDEVGRDELDNPVVEPVLIGSYPCLVTQWTTEEIALLDRDITRTQRKLLTTAPKSIVKHAGLVVGEDESYSIVNVKSDFIRWRLCHVKEHFT